ncbi:hypothetical protein FHR83_003668 [Actinoplanes campanulatus]|uniref:Uncharacterized protein n=1 Tax=Actinoplanes campanulatus TaxID=113559 RepID=A0A7W5AGS1_9ACTN|nr:hypothetical protein [Actinoplanes campanulatus]MBB3095998.1 hypothetical protein [Actinoplanes campanulatus]GGN13008.1 hypothetical protein GCM10010109_23810 [Actinoplanes campanulatus]GID36908.1 hypothetical protein Aca09nite_34140 [Actinoplanes campanulatus]
MTAAKPNHLRARRLLLDHLDIHPGRTVGDDLDPLEAGIVGDTDHAAGGDSYHLGKSQIRARGGRDRYSVDESPRDRSGLDDHASAMDIGFFRLKTPRGTFDLYDFNAWLIPLCKAGDPDTRDLREVIYSPDGRTVRRWDRLGRRTTGDDSHRTHTHLSEHRDADGHRMVRLATRWLRHIQLLPEEDTMTKAEFLAMLKDKDVRAALAGAMLQTDGLIPAPPGNKNPDGTANTHWSLASYAQWTYRHLIDARTAITTLATRDQVDEVALAGALAPMLAAALPGDRDDLTPAELQQAIVGALRELAGSS